MTYIDMFMLLCDTFYTLETLYYTNITIVWENSMSMSMGIVYSMVGTTSKLSEIFVEVII